VGPLSRILVWVLLILLTLVLLLFPVHLVYEYHAIQAPYLFENLPLFGVLFCVWILVILFILFSKQDEGDNLNWENLALISMFGLVFLGFWVIITPHGSFTDGLFNMSHVRWLVSNGSIPVGHENLVYFDFPGMHLLVAALSLVTGLGVFESRTLFLVINAVLFCAVLYVLFAKLMKSGRLAFLGVLLVVLGSVLIVDDISTFYPRALAFTMLASFMMLLTRSETRLLGSTLSDRLIMLILFTAMTISYFATPFFAPLILLGIYIVQILSRDTQARVSLRTIILLMFIMIAWEIYWTWHNFSTLAMFLPGVWDSLLSGEFFRNPITMVQANIGGRLPLWATATRSFWWALLAFSTVLGLRNLLRIKELSLVEKIVTGGLLGLIILTIIGTFGTEGGRQFQRFLLYAPIFCAPLLLMFLVRSGTWQKIGIKVITLLIIILALPTFLCSVNSVCTDAIYPYECSVGEFAESHSQVEGESNIIVYSLNAASMIWARYYTPDVLVNRVSEEVYYTGDKNLFWDEVDVLVTKFQKGWTLPGKQKLLVISEKSPNMAQHLLNIPPDNPKWEELWQRISVNNLVYNNGHIQLYGEVFIRQ
jgi:hypothetical protein